MIDHFGLNVEEITKVVTDVHLADFTKDYGEDWEMMPAYLELNSIVARDIKKSNARERERRHEFFDEWKTQKKNGATYERLVYALLKIGNRKDADGVCRMLLSSRHPEFNPSSVTSTPAVNAPEGMYLCLERHAYGKGEGA